MNARPSSATAAATPARDQVLIAVDATRDAGPAIEWATAEAAVRRATTRLVSFGPVGHIDRRVASDSTVVLLAEAARSNLMVVDASGPGAASRWLQRCVPRHAARSSACPIVVVRGAARQPMRRIVVGVDCGAASGAVLDWAADQAVLHQAELAVFHVWRPAGALERSRGGSALARSDGRYVVDLAVRRCGERTRRRVFGELVEGDAASVLVAASSDADLVVVGSRDNGYTTMRFGSVALHVAERAACPVALIPPLVRGRAQHRSSAATSAGSADPWQPWSSRPIMEP